MDTEFSTKAEQFRAETEQDLNESLQAGVDPKREYGRLVRFMLKVFGVNNTNSFQNINNMRTASGARPAFRTTSTCS